MTCCFTGHRAIPVSEYLEIKIRLESEIVRLISQGVRYFGVGGALGFDTMAALAVLKLRKKFPHIRLILILPCKDQSKDWDSENIEIYSYIRDKADKVVYTSEHYHEGCIQKRDLHMIENSGFCIAYLKHGNSGTAQTVCFAKERGLMVYNLEKS